MFTALKGSVSFFFLLHAAKHAVSDLTRYVIQSPDVDVLVLCCSLISSFDFGELWFHTGTRDKTPRFMLSVCPSTNMSVMYTPLFISKTGVCRGIPIFLIFDPKQRLWVLVRTAMF